MSRRFTATDTRWFTNYTDPCLYENALKARLGARTDDEYRQILQTQGQDILQHSFPAPKLELQKDLDSLKQVAASSAKLG
jgi:hypothetical protein